MTNSSPYLRKPHDKAAEDANMLRLYQLGIRIEAIAAQYHLSYWTVKQKLTHARKHLAEYQPKTD